jgi:uncharacterized integral membrane protein
VPLPNATVPHNTNTRIGSVWMAVAIGVVLGVALIDFIVQNTRSVRIEFFSVSGRIPVAVALLAAAVAGALVVLIAGVARTTQLRISRRRIRHQAVAEANAVANANASTDTRAGTENQQPTS